MPRRLWRTARANRTALAALLLIVVVLAGRGEPPRLQPAQTLPTLTLPAPTVGLVPKAGGPQSAGASRAPAAETEHLVLFTSNGSYAPEQLSALAPDLETALAYVQERTTMRLARRVNIMFDRRPGACGLDAVAYTNVRTLVVYVCPETPARRVTTILAHEFVHQLAHDRYGEPHLQADLILSEGLATWGAGRYWLGDSHDFRDFVAQNYGGYLLPLATTPGPDGSAARLNQLYYEWAAFVEWLLALHGPEMLDRLYTARTGRQSGSAPYTALLGRPLADVESSWLEWLD